MKEWPLGTVGQRVVEEAISDKKDIADYTLLAQEMARERSDLAQELGGFSSDQTKKLNVGMEEDFDRISEAVKHNFYAGDGALDATKGSGFDKVRTGVSRIGLWNIMERLGDSGLKTNDVLSLKETAVRVATEIAFRTLTSKGVAIDSGVLAKVASMSGGALADTAGIASDDYARADISKFPASTSVDPNVLKAGVVGIAIASGSWNLVQPARAIATGNKDWADPTKKPNYGSWDKMVSEMYNSALNEKSVESALARAAYEIVKDIEQVITVADKRRLWKEGENKAVDLVRLARGSDDRWYARVIKRKEEGLVPAALKPWAFPGGFVENDEMDSVAAVREAAEEINEGVSGELKECFPRQKVADPRNVDADRWITSRGFVSVDTQPIDETKGVQEEEVAEKSWQPVSELLNSHAMYGGHQEILKAALRTVGA